VQNAPVGPPATSFVRSVVRTEALAIVAGYAGVEMLDPLELTSAALRVAVDRLAPEMFRTAALAKFPVLRLHAPYLPDDTDWRRTYARHAKLADEYFETRSRAVLPMPTTTLDDYLFVAQVMRHAHRSGDASETFAYALRLDESDPCEMFAAEGDRDMILVAEDALDISMKTLFGLGDGSERDDANASECGDDESDGDCDASYGDPPPSILLTVLQKSTGKTAVLCHFRGIKDVHNKGLFYLGNTLPLVHAGVEAHVADAEDSWGEMVPFRVWERIGAEASVSLQHDDDTSVSDRPAKLRVRFMRTDRLDVCFSLQAGLVMLEHNIRFT